MEERQRQRGLLIPFLQVVSDIAVIEATFLISHWLRFHSFMIGVLPVTRGVPPLSVYIYSSWPVALLWIFIMETNGLYGVRRNKRLADEFAGIVKSVTLGMLLAAAGAFFYRKFSFSRIVFVYIWIISILLLTVTRWTIIKLERALHRKGRGVVHAAIMGSSPLGEDLRQAVGRHPGLGIEIDGYIGSAPAAEGDASVLGDRADLPGIIKERDLGIIFLSFSEDESGELVDIMKSCTGLHVEFYLVPDVLKLMTTSPKVEQLDGIPLLKIKDTAIAGWRGIFKRAADLVISGAALLVLSPIILAISLAVALTSRGPVFYRQERVGLDGRRFSLIKFRSMRTGAESGSGPVWTVEGDSRVTPLGKFLRRFSLDELPQLLNVFRGEMSLVGPRPERPVFVDRFKESVPKYLERHRVKSGMTGWAQVNGMRGNVPIEERTKFDIYYVENWSFLFDMKIILLTVWTVIKGNNSY